MVNLFALFHNKYQKFDLNPVVPLYGKKSMLVLSLFSIFTLAPRNEPLKSILVHCEGVTGGGDRRGKRGGCQKGLLEGVDRGGYQRG